MFDKLYLNLFEYFFNCNQANLDKPIFKFEIKINCNIFFFDCTMKETTQNQITVEREETVQNPLSVERQQEHHKLSPNPAENGGEQRNSSIIKRVTTKIKEIISEIIPPQAPVSAFDPAEQQPLSPQKCSMTKKIVIGLAIISAVLAIIGIILGLTLGLLDRQISPLVRPGLKLDEKILPNGVSLITVAKKLDQDKKIINLNGAISVQGNYQQNVRLQKQKLKLSVQLIRLIEESCSKIDQDANKLIQSQSGLFKIYQALLLFLGKEGLNIKGLNLDKIKFLEIDNQNYVQIQYDDEEEKFKISTLEQEPAKLDSNAEQKPLSNANLPKCQVQKALPIIVQILKVMIEKNIKAYKKEIANGGKEQIQSLVADPSGSEQQNLAIKQFTDNCIYLDDVTYNCRVDAVASVIQQQPNLQGTAALDSGQSNRFETQSLKIVFEI